MHQVEKDGQDVHPVRKQAERPQSPPTYVVLDLSACVGVDGEPSLLVLSLDVGVLGRQRVLDLQPRRHSRHLAVAGVGQDTRQLHQEGRLGTEEPSAPRKHREQNPIPHKTQGGLTAAPSPAANRHRGGSIPRLRALSS